MKIKNHYPKKIPWLTSYFSEEYTVCPGRTAQPDAGSVIKKCKERGDSVVELDNFKSTLQGYKAPLQEVRVHFDLANKEEKIQELEARNGSS